MRNLFLALCALCFVACKNPEKTVGLVLPLAHPAVIDIQDGFIATLKKSHPNYKVVVKNAMGDPNLMQSILKSLHSQNVAYVVPVGTTTTTAAQSFCPGQTIVGLAADSRLTEKNPHTYVVSDEVGAAAVYDFFVCEFPRAKSVSIIYSNNDKTTLAAREFRTLLEGKSHCKVQMLAVLTTNDLQTVCTGIKGDVVVVLKDLMVTSGLEVIIRKTKALGIPLMVCDEGSVKNGADVGFVVKERDTGVKGAALLGQIIEGKNPVHAVEMKAKRISYTGDVVPS